MFVAMCAGALIGLVMLNVDGETFIGVYRAPMSILSPSPRIWTPLLAMLITVAIGLASAPAAVNVFGDERAVFWREAAAGHNRFSYFLGKTILALYRSSVASLHFAALVMLVIRPMMTFGK